MFVSSVEKKNFYDLNEVHTSKGCLIIFSKCVHKTEKN